MQQTQKDISDEIFCDVCGMTYREFLETGVFRCENCYRVFKESTVKLLKSKIENSEYRYDNEKKVLVRNVVSSQKQTNNKDKIKERIKELEELLELCQRFDEKEKIQVIEEELAELRKIEIEK